MSAHPSASDKAAMEHLVTQRRMAYLLTLDEGEREAQGQAIDAMDILEKLEKLGISIGYAVPRQDGAPRQPGQFMPEGRATHRAGRESSSSSSRETEEERATESEEKAEREITRSLLLRTRFSGTKGESWRSYRMEWEGYLSISGLRKCSQEFQKLALFNMLAGAALQRAQTIKPASPKFVACEDHDSYLDIIGELFCPAKEKSLLRTEFKKRFQKRGESVADYFATKLSLFYESYADYNLPYIILLEATLEGLASDHVKKAITESSPQNEEELQATILKSVSDSAVLYSLGVQGYSTNTRLSKDLEGLNAISDRKEHRERGRGRARGGDSRGSDPHRPQQDLSEVECWACGKRGHYSQDCRGGGGRGSGPHRPQRDLSEVECWACGKWGHYSRECRSKEQESGGKPPQGNRNGRRGRNQQQVRSVGQGEAEQEDQQPAHNPDQQWDSWWESEED